MKLNYFGPVTFASLIGLAQGANVGAKIPLMEKTKQKQDKERRKNILKGAITTGATSGLFSALAIRSINRAFKNAGNFSTSTRSYKANTNHGENFNSILQTMKTKKDATNFYRNAAMKNHPDKGGSKDVMQDINNTWNYFKKTKFNKLAFLKSMKQFAFENELEKIAYTIKPSVTTGRSSAFGLNRLLRGQSNLIRKPYEILTGVKQAVLGGSYNTSVKPPKSPKIHG